MHEQDQRYRTLDKLDDKTFQKMRFLDWKNLQKAESVLRKFTLEQIVKTNPEFPSLLFFIIQHSDLAIQKAYFPKLQTAVSRGLFNPRQLAKIEDRIAVSEGKEQIYGSQIAYNEEENYYYLYPVRDFANVDEVRKKIGLEPLKDYVRRWNIEL